MSDFDKLLATLMAGGSNVNVIVIQAVHAGGVVDIKNGCIDVEKSGAPTPKKTQGEKKNQGSQAAEVDDEHTTAADEEPVGGEDAPIDAAPVERNRGSSVTTPHESSLLGQAKEKLLGLNDELTNSVVNDIDKLDKLSDNHLQKILHICNKWSTQNEMLDELDELLDKHFPEYACQGWGK